MFNEGPSPLAMVVLTLIIGGHMTVDETPAMVEEEVRYYYPFIVGKPLPENGEE